MDIPFKVIEIIKKYEGFKSKAYKCPAGEWTIGYGTTTYKNGEPVKEGDRITEEEAIKEIFVYINLYCKPEIEDIEKKVKHELTENQRCALISLIYNVGNRSFSKSRCKKCIISGNVSGACKEWDWGIKQGLKGLIRRRNEEIELFYGIKDFWKC